MGVVKKKCEKGKIFKQHLQMWKTNSIVKISNNPYFKIVKYMAPGSEVQALRRGQYC